MYNIILIKPHGCGTEIVRRSLLSYSKINNLKSFDVELHDKPNEIFNKNHDNANYDLSTWHTWWEDKYINRHKEIMNKNKKTIYITCIRNPLERYMSRYYLHHNLINKYKLNFNDFYLKFGHIKHHRDLDNNYISKYLGFNDINEITIDKINERYSVIFDTNNIDKALIKLKNEYNIDLPYERYISCNQSSKNKVKDPSFISEEVKNLFEKNNQLDYKLYNIIKCMHT